MFITLEGIDGSGKSTIASKIVERLELRYTSENVLHLCQPSKDLPFGKFMREILSMDDKDDVHKIKTNAYAGLLIAIDRINQVEQLIKPALQDNKFVVCDRYTGSSYAYNTDYADALKLIHDTLPKPDITFYIDISIETSKNRRKSRENEDFMEHDLICGALRRYRKLAMNEKNWITIDGEQDVDSVFNDCLKHLPMFNNNFYITPINLFNRWNE
jgi:dTMP kinase